MFIQVAAIVLSLMLMLGTIVIVWSKTNGSVAGGHIFMFLIGFLCFLVASDVVPSEISWGNFHVVLVKSMKQEIVALRDETSKDALSRLNIDAAGLDGVGGGS